jgi:uncharacterized protein involved in response to NO
MSDRIAALRGGRLFFPLALGLGALWVPIWMLRYSGILDGPVHFAGGAWHGHEMIFGYLGAVLAGFLTVGDSGWRVVFLAALWALARILLMGETGTAPLIVAAIDLAFLPLLLLLRRPPLWSGAKLMMLGIATVIIGLSAVNGWSHVAAMSGDTGRAHLVAADFVVLLLIVVAGRLVPGHTRAAVRRGPGLSLTRAEYASMALAAALIGASALGADRLAGLVAAALALLQAYRLWRWWDRAILGDSLLWGLHLGFAWLVLALAFRACSEFGLIADRMDALHVLFVGAIGTLTLSVIMRLLRAQHRLPQTGGGVESLVLALVALAAVLRAVLPAIAPDWRMAGSGIGALCWSGAYLLALGTYAPLIVGRPESRTRPAPRGSA